MAVRTEESSARRTWVVALSVVALVAVALFLRAYWNLDAAEKDGQFVLSGGSDPYYHKRAVDCIQEGGCSPGQAPWTTLIHDPLLNYPYGATNPNPPLYEWSIAVAGEMMAPFFGGDRDTSTWWATEWSPAVYGALTVIPIYFIGAALFDRRVGMVAALFWTLSTSAIDASGLGDADHDAAVMFFASLAFLFYIKALALFRGDANWVSDWRNGATVGPGLSRFFRERRLAIGYSLLTGIAIAAVALIWKGFPYVIGILFAYAGLQMILDHWKSRDSTGLFVGTFIAMLVGTILAYPYYAAAEVGTFLRPVWFLLVGFLAAGLVLVPTRDFPTILVLPAALVVAIVGAVVAFFVLPDVARSLLYATVYFKQTALYETIAEAHPADFSSIVFGIGPVPFFLAFFGWVYLLFTLRQHAGRPILFALVWGGIALFMANSAIRFLFNAIPVFAVFGAFMLMWIVDWLDFATIRKSIAANAGSFWTGFRKGVRPMQIVGVVLLALLLVFPNVMLAADAALPPESENRYCKEAALSDETAELCDSGDPTRVDRMTFLQRFYSTRMGAYGQGFIQDYWLEGLHWLDEYDAGVAPADRPAFLSWWDYGHWAIAVGNHPTVADNFQNGYEYAANFILAQNETHAIQLLSARLVDLPTANAQQALADVGVTDTNRALEDLRAFRYNDELTIEKALALLQKVESNTGKRIRYFTTDIRMLPYDNPGTPQVEQPSIYYAPVTLAGRDTNEFLTTQIEIGEGQFISEDQYRERARNPITQTPVIGERLQFQEAFFNSMFYRSYVGDVPSGPFPATGDTVLSALNNPHPAQGLEHFRLVYVNDGLKIVEFYYGATVTGRVLQGGQPVDGASILVLDDSGKLLRETFTEEGKAATTDDMFNSVHTTTTSDASGAYSVRAPFGENVTILATKDGVELARANLAITREEAAVNVTKTADLVFAPGIVSGIVFEDKDGDSQYVAQNDTALEGIHVTIGGESATSGPGGEYTITNVPAGVQNVTVENASYQVSPLSARVRVAPDTTTPLNVSLELRPATATGAVYADLDDDGTQGAEEALSSFTVTFTADANATENGARTTTARTDASGVYNTTLRPGSYIVTAETTTADQTRYAISVPLVVATGEAVTLDLRLAKE